MGQSCLPVVRFLGRGLRGGRLGGWGVKGKPSARAVRMQGGSPQMGFGALSGVKYCLPHIGHTFRIRFDCGSRLIRGLLSPNISDRLAVSALRQGCRVFQGKFWLRYGSR